MLDSMYHMTPKTTWKSSFLCGNAKILPYIRDIITNANT